MRGCGGKRTEPGSKNSTCDLGHNLELLKLNSSIIGILVLLYLVSIWATLCFLSLKLVLRFFFWVKRFRGLFEVVIDV